MKEFKHYVYVYLDPRKPGNYTYLENGIGISFDYEPFYIGEGRNNRLYIHLKRAKKNIKHPLIQKIRKIWSAGLEPIIYKICEFENEQDALDVEGTLGFLVGRYDQKRGPLTNLIDCGGKSTNLSKESQDKKNKTRKETFKNDPTIQIRVSNSFKENWKNKTEEEKNLIREKQNQEKRLPQSQLKRHLSRISNNSLCGPAPLKGKDFNFDFIIINYFNGLNISEIARAYTAKYNKISNDLVTRILKILNFPIKSKKDNKEFKKNFILNNKDNINFFIDNFILLEENYYKNLYEERNKKYFLNQEETTI